MSKPKSEVQPRRSAQISRLPVWVFSSTSLDLVDERSRSMRKHARFGWYCHELPNYDNHKASYAAQLDGDLHSTEAPSNRHSGVMSASGQEMSLEYASEKNSFGSLQLEFEPQIGSERNRSELEKRHRNATLHHLILLRMYTWSGDVPLGFCKCISLSKPSQSRRL